MTKAERDNIIREKMKNYYNLKPLLEKGKNASRQAHHKTQQTRAAREQAHWAAVREANAKREAHKATIVKQTHVHPKYRWYYKCSCGQFDSAGSLTNLRAVVKEDHKGIEHTLEVIK